jgi:hypothetical protein
MATGKNNGETHRNRSGPKQWNQGQGIPEISYSGDGFPVEPLEEQGEESKINDQY